MAPIVLSELAVPPVPNGANNPNVVEQTLRGLTENANAIRTRLTSAECKDTAFAMLIRERREQLLAIARLAGVEVEPKGSDDGDGDAPAEAAPVGLKIDLSKLPAAQREKILRGRREDVPN